MFGRVRASAERNSFGNAQATSIQKMIEGVARQGPETAYRLGRLIHLLLEEVKKVAQLLGRKNVWAIRLGPRDRETHYGIFRHQTLAHQVTAEPMKGVLP